MFDYERPALLFNTHSHEDEDFKIFKEACEDSPMLCVTTDGKDERLNELFGPGEHSPLKALRRTYESIEKYCFDGELSVNDIR